jgi:hypothetical protein
MADNLKIDMSKYSNIDDNGNIIKPSENILDSIVNSAPMNALLGFGDAAGNLIRGGLHQAGKPFGTSFDPATLIQQNRNPQGDLQFQQLQSGQGGAYNMGNIAGNVASPLAFGELLAPLKLGQMAEALPGILKSAPQIAGWSALGAAGNPNNLQKGLAEGAIGGAIGESVAPLAKGTGKLADYLSEKFYPEKFSKELVDQLRGNYTSTKQTATDMYNNVINKYKDSQIIDKDLLKNNPIINKDLLKGKTSDLYNNFYNDPSVYNAHKLQSELNKQSYRVNNPFHANYDPDKADTLLSTKDMLKSMIDNHLSLTNPSDSQAYKQASQFYASQVMPYRTNQNLYNIVSNKERSIEPSDLSKALEDVSNQNKVPENHYIAQANKELEKRLFGGKILGKTVQKTPGGQMIAPGMASILSSPTIRNFGKLLQSPYEGAKYAILANLLQGNQ